MVATMFAPTETLISDMITTLRNEAANAGDTEQVDLCERAQQGDAEARERCAAAITDARAMCDTPLVRVVASPAPAVVGWYFGPNHTLILRSDGSTEKSTKENNTEDTPWLITYDRGADEYGAAYADGHCPATVGGALVVGAATTEAAADTITTRLMDDDDAGPRRLPTDAGQPLAL